MLEMVEGDRRTLSAIYKKIEAKGLQVAASPHPEPPRKCSIRRE